MEKNLNNINLSALESALRSDFFDNEMGRADDFKIAYVIDCFPKDYKKTFQGRFESVMSHFGTAVMIYEQMKENMGIFAEIQFRAYGWYGNDMYDGKYDVLEIKNVNGKSWRIDRYDNK